MSCSADCSGLRRERRTRTASSVVAVNAIAASAASDRQSMAKVERPTMTLYVVIRPGA